jgi:hypothetical protein
LAKGNIFSKPLTHKKFVADALSGALLPSEEHQKN